jgi:hypothetical protein
MRGSPSRIFSNSSAQIGNGRIPDKLTIPEWATVRIEESQMIVRKNGVAFVASPRGTAAFVGTGELPMEVLQRASEQPQ